jgi:hypothetical protein
MVSSWTTAIAKEATFTLGLKYTSGIRTRTLSAHLNERRTGVRSELRLTESTLGNSTAWLVVPDKSGPSTAPQRQGI